MEGHAELYNIDDGNGTTKNFLSAGLTQLRFLYIIFSFSYLTLLGFWILVCFKNRRIFNRTHLLKGGLLLVNCVHFMCVAADLHHVKMTGTAHGLDVVFFIFQLMTAVLLSTVIVLIGAGWFFWKPFLKREEELVLMIVIVLEVWANVDPIMPWEAAVPYNNKNGSLADVIYCFAIYFSIALSSILLDEIRETDLNGNKNKLWLFMMLTIVYVLITKLFLLALSTRWEVYVVKETTILVFCMSILYIFRPGYRARITNAAETTGLSTSNSISCFYSPV
ncbi:protein CANDIDATE G-PROTEIN COUPLED RECEPTOR 7 [Lactuca sativa]|uniref:protein CANDIDATE G-PROTEIN COUPLED RECEPTOR 7 n=1 Tax=Lactuca sativa TaxID=4236 RepID=UPI000CD9CA4F|nr:protein CANDIDATE G-PROTEIN COUPLED RECEPTOR 7 [Lactuca sativa]